MLAQTQQADHDDNNSHSSRMSPHPAESQTVPGVSPLSSPVLDSAPPVFNILVVGQAGIGKTGLIKLLIDTSLLSSNTTTPRLARLAEFANYAATCPTTSLSYATADLPATNHRPQMVLNLIDTPGLLFHDPQELEKGVNLALRKIIDCFSASRAVPAQERADKQIHLCLYLLDPADIVPSSTRHLRKPDRYGVPTKLSTTRQRVHLAAVRNVANRPGDLGSTSTSSGEFTDTQHYDDGDEWGRATVPKAELRVMRRLSEYVSVLPVVAKADTLTTERLDTVKSAVRRDFLETGLSFSPFDGPDISPVLHPRTPPSDIGTAFLPYAIILPDRYHHGDGVARSGTLARPSHQDYMIQYQSAQITESTAVTQDGVRPIDPGEFTRTYRWGRVDILERSNSDFLALREAILGSNVEVLRSRTLDFYFETYKKDLASTSALSPTLHSTAPTEQSHQKSPPPESIAGPTQPPLPSLPPTSLFSYQINTRSSYHQGRITAQSEYSLPPLEMPMATGSREKMFQSSRPAPLAPISAVLNPPLKHVRSAPALASPEEETPRSPVTSSVQPTRQRTGRKIAVACNFCRSRKLKCDGGRPQCIQCMRRTVDCEYEPAAKRRGLGKHATPAMLPKAGEGTSHQLTTSTGDEDYSLPPKTVACQFCRARKTRCDGLQPRCSNCEKRNQECVYLAPPTLEEEIASMGSRPRSLSGSGAAPWPPTQLPPSGPSSRPSTAGYRPQLQPLSQALPHAAIWRPPDSPPTLRNTMPSQTLPPRQPDIDPYTRIGSFAPPLPTHPVSFGMDVRKTDAPTGEAYSWRDRGSISSSSTRGGFSATPSSPAIKRKASYLTEEEGREEQLETSPSPSKRRRRSTAEDVGYFAASAGPLGVDQIRPPSQQKGGNQEERRGSGSSYGKRK